MAKRARRITREEFKGRAHRDATASLPKVYNTFFSIGNDTFILSDFGDAVKKVLPAGLAPGDETTKAFVAHLHQAVSRMRSLDELESTHIFLLSFTIQDSNFSMLPYMVGIRAGLLDEFCTYSSHPEFAALTTLIESGYFHELVHYVQYLRSDDPNEITSLMGEFLYNPGLNAIRNEYKFSDYSFRGSEFVRTGKRPGKKEHYVLGWLVAAKLLIAELSDSGRLAVPPSVEEQLTLLPRLPQLFAAVEQDARDRILARYIRLAKRNLEMLSKEAGRRAGLLF